MIIKYRNMFIFRNHCWKAEEEELMDFVGYNRGVRDTLFHYAHKDMDKWDELFYKAQYSFPDRITLIKSVYKKEPENIKERRQSEV